MAEGHMELSGDKPQQAVIQGHISLGGPPSGVTVVIQRTTETPKTNSLGLPVTKTYGITKTEALADGVHVYELTDAAGNVIVTGAGDVLMEALFNMAAALEADENPDP